MYKIVRKEKLSDKIYLMDVEAPRVAHSCLPGQFIIVKIDEIIEEGTWRDPKSYVQELAQREDGVTPVYKTLKEEGPDHDKTFTVGLYVKEHLMGTGTGHSKQEAQTAAAREGVKKYRQKTGNKSL